MEKEKLKAIVFDFDGTIADTEGFYADNFFEVMEGYGIHCDAEDRVKTLGYGPDEKVAMMHSKKYNYYKLPGGGMEPEETAALTMEMAKRWY